MMKISSIFVAFLENMNFKMGRCLCKTQAIEKSFSNQDFLEEKPKNR